MKATNAAQIHKAEEKSESEGDRTSICYPGNGAVGGSDLPTHPYKCHAL